MPSLRRAICTTTSKADATCSRTAACGRSRPAISASSSIRRSASSGLFACTVVSEPSCPVVIACSMSSASPPLHLADHEAVGAHAQGVADELADPDLSPALETRPARLEPRDVRAIDAQLGGILHGDDALGGVDPRSERAEQRRLSARGAAADHDREPRPDAGVEQSGIVLP